MDSADPLCAVSSTTCLLHRTLGGPAPAASPSKADEALLRGISGTLKGSKELIEQSKIAMKEYGDIRMVYQDNGGKASAAANLKNNQLGRRPAGEHKRHRFTMKYPASKPLPVVDRSVLDSISDPDEYFVKEIELDEAEAEIKRLNGEVQPKRTLNFEPVVERKRRNSSRPRKSYFFSSDAYAASATMIPASQSENMTESQTSQDDTHASVSEKNEQAVPSRSDKCAISDSLMEKESFAEKDKGDVVSNIMASFQNFDGLDKLDFLRKTIGIGEIRMEKIYRRHSVLGDMSLSTAQINPQEFCTLEGPLSGSHQARVSELAKGIFRDAELDKGRDLSKDDGFEGHTLERPLPGSHQTRVSELAECVFGDAAMDNDNHTDLLKDDEFEGSPDIVMGEQSLTHDSSDVALMTDETFSANEKGREAPSPKSVEHVLDPEPNMPDSATIDDNPCSRHNISTEKDNMPMGCSPIDKSDNEAIISSHHLEDASTEVLAKTQDKSTHSLEKPPEDIGLQNQSQAPDGTIKTLTADLRSALSPTKEKTQKTAQRGKTKKRPKRGKKVADGPHHSLEIPQADLDSENQPHTHDVNTEQQGLSNMNASSPNKPKGQKEAKRRNRAQELNKRKSFSDAGLEWQSGVRRSTRIRHRPLDHWRGERFVYGRIHDTMVTVIGVKSYSPVQGGKGALKVKSFVSEQYSDIVAQGAKY